MPRMVAAAMGLALCAAACGSPSSAIPDVPECPAAAPLPTSRTTPGAVSVQAFFARVREGTARLYQAREDLRADYPEDTFYRREDFRPDFIAYADETICTSRALRELSAPIPAIEEFERRLDAALSALIDHTLAGRDAVRTRNVSEYRDWFAGVDERIGEVLAAARR
jgi:hypothetical protein